MGRHSGGGRLAVGSTTFPLISLYAAAATRPTLREVGLFNTTAVALEVYLCRLTSTGTQGAAIVEAEHDPEGAPPLCTLWQTHSGAPSLGEDLGFRGVIGAAIGAGLILTFGADGIRTPVGTGNGLGILIENGTGQICQGYMVWDE